LAKSASVFHGSYHAPASLPVFVAVTSSPNRFAQKVAVSGIVLVVVAAYKEHKAYHH
jgi:hypothetical protein